MLSTKQESLDPLIPTASETRRGKILHGSVDPSENEIFRARWKRGSERSAETSKPLKQFTLELTRVRISTDALISGLTVKCVTNNTVCFSRERTAREPVAWPVFTSCLNVRYNRRIHQSLRSESS